MIEDVDIGPGDSMTDNRCAWCNRPTKPTNVIVGHKQHCSYCKQPITLQITERDGVMPPIYHWSSVIP